MTVYNKFIKIKGNGAKALGYLTPRLYQLVWSKNTLKTFGFLYIIARLKGYTIWWITNKKDFDLAIKNLNELKNARILDYEVCERL